MQTKLLVDKQYYEQAANPHFLVKDGCVFFSSHFEEKNYRQWKKIERSKEKLERTINHIHLNDLVDNYDNQLKLGRKIKKIWQNELKKIFPSVTFDLKLNTIYIENEKELILDLNVKTSSRSKLFIKPLKKFDAKKINKTPIKRVIPLKKVKQYKGYK